MAVSLQYLGAGRGVLLVGTGVVTASEFHDAKAELMRSVDRTKHLVYGLIDFSDATTFTASGDDIRGLAEADYRLAKLAPHAVVAIVAPTDSVFGLARMWEALAEATGWSTRVFRARREAEAWLARESMTHGRSRPAVLGSREDA